MTQQYLSGELSLLLAELQAASPDQTASTVAHLRRRAESEGPRGLASVVDEACELADRLCWESLQAGAADAFISRLRVCAAIYEFGSCAGLLMR